MNNNNSSQIAVLQNEQLNRNYSNSGTSFPAKKCFYLHFYQLLEQYRQLYRYPKKIGNEDNWNNGQNTHIKLIHNWAQKIQLDWKCSYRWNSTQLPLRSHTPPPPLVEPIRIFTRTFRNNRKTTVLVYRLALVLVNASFILHYIFFFIIFIVCHIAE